LNIYLNFIEKNYVQ